MPAYDYDGDAKVSDLVGIEQFVSSQEVARVEPSGLTLPQTDRPFIVRRTTTVTVDEIEFPEGN